MKALRPALFAAVAACSQPVQPTNVQNAPANDVADAAASIRPQDFYARIGFLASDALEGRDTPSPGLEVAAAYIGSEFHRMGLEPGGDNGTWLQRWPFTVRGLDVSSVRFDVQGPAGQRPLAYRSDFYVSGGARGTFTGGLVYAGDRVPDAPVRGTLLRNRAVLVALSAGEAQQPQLVRARAAADSAGAGALILILPESTDAMGIAQLAAGAERATRGVPSIPVFHLRRDRARELLQAARLDLQELTRTQPARPVELAGVTASLGATIGAIEHRPPNVVGILRGSDPGLRDEYIIFSAHIDHTGICAPAAEDRICNGADDDASGTSAIMELAEAFSLMRVKPRRSLVFLGVSGEEKGLLGSAHYADNPTVPIANVVANVNVDMIGRNHPDSVVVIGQTYSSLGPLLHRINQQNPQLRMTVSDDLWPEQRFFFRSDHFNFARREVPAIFFFTGTHEDYHRPSDTVDKIDLDKITRITQLIFHYGLAIANQDQRPAWDPAGLEEVRRLVSQRGQED